MINGVCYGGRCNIIPEIPGSHRLGQIGIVVVAPIFRARSPITDEITPVAIIRHVPARGTETVAYCGVSVVVEAEDGVGGVGCSGDDSGVFIPLAQSVVSGHHRPDCSGDGAAVAVSRGAQVGLGPALAANLHGLIDVAVEVGHRAARDLRVVGGGEGEQIAIYGLAFVLDKGLIVVFGVWREVVEHNGHCRIRAGDKSGVILINPVALLPEKSFRRQGNIVGIMHRAVERGRRLGDMGGAVGRGGGEDGRGEREFIAVVSPVVVGDERPVGILGVFIEVLKSTG